MLKPGEKVTPKTETKKVTFFQLRALTPDGMSDVEQVNWGSLLAKWTQENSTLQDRNIDGLYFENDPDHELPVVGLHRPLKDDFKTVINTQTGLIRDSLSGDESGEFIATSSVAAFIGIENVFAFALGSGNSSPSNKNMENLANQVCPFPSRDQSWKVVPVMDDAKIREFMDSDGAIRFSGSFSSRKDLFTRDATGVATFVDQVAAELDSEIEIQLEIKLGQPGRQSPVARAKFLDFLRPSVERLSGGKRAKVTVRKGLSEVEISLMEERFSVEAEVEATRIESRKFSALMEAVVLAGVENKGIIREMFGGDDSHGGVRKST